MLITVHCLDFSRCLSGTLDDNSSNWQLMLVQLSLSLWKDKVMWDEG